MVRIRRYEAEDAGPVSRLIRTTMRVSNAADYPPDRLQPLMEYFSPEKVDQLNGERVCLVAEEGEEVVGTVGLDGRELVTFFVHPEHQGRGIGSALLEAIESAASAAGIGQLEVSSSLTGVHFYERRGYRRSGPLVDGTAGPQVPMRKRIG